VVRPVRNSARSFLAEELDLFFLNEIGFSFSLLLHTRGPGALGRLAPSKSLQCQRVNLSLATLCNTDSRGGVGVEPQVLSQTLSDWTQSPKHQTALGTGLHRRTPSPLSLQRRTVGFSLVRPWKVQPGSPRKRPLPSDSSKTVHIIVIYFFGFHCIEGYNVAITPSNIELEVRREILEGLKADGVDWYGRLNELDFLQSLYDLKQLPSNDPRHPDALGDFYRHRINNPYDWDDDWIYSDKRFGLVDGQLELFLNFITKIVDPSVRRDEEESEEIAEKINRSLRRMGYELAFGELTYSGVKYVAQKIRPDSYQARRTLPLSTHFDNEGIKRKIEQLEEFIESDPTRAIGDAKELLESCFKFILDSKNVKTERDDNMKALSKKVCASLKLLPEDIDQDAPGAEICQKILGNLAVLTQFVAELRNHYGTGHGRDGSFRGLQPRHARLAAGVAIVYIEFLWETFQQR